MRFASMVDEGFVRIFNPLRYESKMYNDVG